MMIWIKETFIYSGSKYNWLQPFCRTRWKFLELKTINQQHIRERHGEKCSFNIVINIHQLETESTNLGFAIS
jgi:hypothetical protein